MTHTPTPVVEFDQVRVSRAGREVLTDVSLRVLEGEFFAIIGPNGGGKTTLLQVMLGLLAPQAGAVRVLGAPPEVSRSRVGYVPQMAGFRRDFPVTVREVVLMGRLGRPLTWGPYRRGDRQAARQALRDVALENLGDRAIGTLSGGQLQRVLIARAIVNQPSLLLLDEPTANVDARAEQDLVALLQTLNRRATIVLVTHDIGLATAVATRVASVNGRLQYHDPTALDATVITAVFSGLPRAERPRPAR